MPTTAKTKTMADLIHESVDSLGVRAVRARLANALMTTGPVVLGYAIWSGSDGAIVSIDRSKFGSDRAEDCIEWKGTPLAKRVPVPPEFLQPVLVRNS